MLVRDIMTPNPVTIRPGQTLLEAAQAFRHFGFDTLPVVDENNRAVGLLTKTHLLGAIINGQDNTTAVASLMDRNFVPITPDTPVKTITELGTKRWLVNNEQGVLVGVLTRTDLIRVFRQQAEMMAEEQATIFRAIQNGILVIDNRGIITMINPAAEKMMRVTAEDVIGKRVDQVLPDTGLLEVMNSGEPQFGKRLTYGADVFISNRAPLIRKGDVVGAVGVFQDISDLEHALQELQVAKQLKDELEAIIESFYDGIYITDGQGYTLRVNSAYERISGYSASELIGRHMRELVEQGYYSDSSTLHVLEKKEPVTLMHELKNGKRLLITGNPVFNDRGEIVRVVTNVRDITELNMLREQLEETRRLQSRYEEELKELRLQLSNKEIVARSAGMQQALSVAMRVAKVDTTVLLLGESGVGKEVVAQVIHKSSPRRDGPFIKINCGAIPESLLESELFGYEKGSFTGANREGKTGLLELAQDGTVLLDEIGELPLALQVKLLRVLQERELTRLGGKKPVPLNIRVIASTNRCLEEMVKAGTFREDLYYRLNVVPITIPPLRERVDDIVPLVMFFLRKFNEEYNMQKTIDSAALEAMQQYQWPGNVRELKNVVERMMVLSLETVLHVKHLPPVIRGTVPAAVGEPKEIIPLKEAVERAERENIAKALKKYGSTYKAAAVLGVDQSTVARKAKKYGLLTVE